MDFLLNAKKLSPFLAWIFFVLTHKHFYCIHNPVAYNNPGVVVAGGDGVDVVAVDIYYW